MALYLLFWLKEKNMEEKKQTNISHKVKTLLDVDCVRVGMRVYEPLKIVADNQILNSEEMWGT